MTSDELPSAAQLCAEIEQMSVESLRAAANNREWPLHPLRVELDTTTRLAAARQAIADFDRPHALGMWREPGRFSRSEVSALRLQALAGAWARLDGGYEFLFHQRGERRPGEDRMLTRRHHVGGAPRIEINPNVGVPPAPYLEHPISLAEAARFAIVLPIMRCCVPLGETMASAFDALGQPTAALHLRAQQQTEPPVRYTVFRIRSAARSAASCVRVLNYAVLHVLRELGATAELEQIGVPTAAQWCGYWTQLEAAIIGVLAWRRACERDAVVQPSKFRRHVLTPNPAIIGRRYRELDDPFTPLLAVLWLGCRLHEVSREAITFVIDPQPVST